MTTDLTYLAYTAFLTGSLWIPYVISQVVTNGLLSPSNYVDPTPRPLPVWGKRADRALMNAVEVFAPFAALVLVAHAGGKANASTAFWAEFFFWARLAHAVVYLLGVPYVRTVAFTAGWIAVVAMFLQVVG
jgi:uncharacterized MAPEG superfamily protein